MVEKLFTGEEIELIKKTSDLLDKSLIIVEKLFSNKVDKQGICYLSHLFYVRDNVVSYEEKVVGLMHDTLEDTSINADDLKILGYPDNIINSLIILTKKKGENYSLYVDNVLNSGDEVAIKVKYVDMTHNLNLKRLNALDRDLKEKLENKYKEPYEKLRKYINGGI